MNGHLSHKHQNRYSKIILDSVQNIGRPLTVRSRMIEGQAPVRLQWSLCELTIHEPWSSTSVSLKDTKLINQTFHMFIRISVHLVDRTKLNLVVSVVPFPGVHV